MNLQKSILEQMTISNPLKTGEFEIPTFANVNDQRDVYVTSAYVPLHKQIEDLIADYLYQNHGIEYKWEDLDLDPHLVYSLLLPLCKGKLNLKNDKIKEHLDKALELFYLDYLSELMFEEKNQ